MQAEKHHWRDSSKNGLRIREKLKKRDDLVNISEEELEAMAHNAVEEYFL